MKPDFNRVVAALNHQESDRVPLAEAIIAYEIMSQFLGKPVDEDDVEAQVEFWTEAGYDYIPLTVGMMTPGGVTKESHISKTIRSVLLKDTADEDTDAWNLETTSWIHTEADFEAFDFGGLINHSQVSNLSTGGAVIQRGIVPGFCLAQPGLFLFAQYGRHLGIFRPAA